MAQFEDYTLKNSADDEDTILILDKNAGTNKQLKMSSVNAYVSGKSQEKFNEKLDKNQGSKNYGKILAIDPYGNIIPSEANGGKPYVLEPMTEQVLGGGKAIPKTTETGKVAIDENGQLWSPSSSTEVKNANSATAGIMKLYATSGNNEDGTMTQKAIKEAITEAIDTSIIQALGGDY